MHAVCALLAQSTPVEATFDEQHNHLPPGALLQPLPPHCPHSDGQHSVPASDTTPHAQKLGASLFLAASHVGGAEKLGGAGGSLGGHAGGRLGCGGDGGRDGSEAEGTAGGNCGGATGGGRAGGDGGDGGLRHAVCALLAHTRPVARIADKQHTSEPPGALPQPLPPHCPHADGQHSVPASDSMPHAQNLGALLFSAAVHVGGGDSGGNTGGSFGCCDGGGADSGIGDSGGREGGT